MLRTTSAWVLLAVRSWTSCSARFTVGCNLEPCTHYFRKNRQGQRAEHATQAILGELMPAPTIETSEAPAPPQPPVHAERTAEIDHGPEIILSGEKSMDSDDGEDDGDESQEDDDEEEEEERPNGERRRGN